VIDDLIDFGSQLAGNIDYSVVHGLYRKGLVFLEVPIGGKHYYEFCFSNEISLNNLNFR
jgi:hypothetical protein